MDRYAFASVVPCSWDDGASIAAHHDVISRRPSLSLTLWPARCTRAEPNSMATLALLHAALPSMSSQVSTAWPT